MSNTLVDFVIEQISGLQYYKEQFPNWNGDFNTNVSCPFLHKHEKGTDDKASFSININNKGGCVCHSCGTKIASIVHFEKAIQTKRGALDDETAASRIYGRFIRPVVAAPSEVQAAISPYLNALQSAPKVFRSLQNEISITPATIDRFDLGWEPSHKRITIPIFDKFNQLINVRRYRLPSMRDDPSFPKLLNLDGFGKPAALFPAPSITSLCKSKHRPPVSYWFTGERDTLLAWSRGVPGFCYTTGENVCKKEWLKDLEELNCSIAVVQDNDKAGIAGAQKRIDLLEAAGIPCFLVEMPGEGVKDFSDYLHPQKGKGTVENFLKIGAKPRKIPEPEDREEEEEPSEYYPIPKVFDPCKGKSQGEFAVSAIGRSPELLNKRINVRAIVSGKMERTYSLPCVFQVGDHLYKLAISREMLQLIRCKDDAILKLLAGWLNTKARIKIMGHITVTEVEIIPMIQPGIDALYVNQRCYFFGEKIECNKPYLMDIIPTTDMNTQESIGMIINISPVSNVLDSYKFTPANYELLKDNFQPEPSSSIMDGLYELAHSVAVNHSGIYNRDDLHLVAMLCWLSPLQFEFPFEGLQRGWLNALVLGDTETGKSKVCQKVCSLFNCGVFINAESCSYVGLVGGAVKSSSGMFLLRWGKIPLYNRQLVVVEELSGLSTEEISYMSAVRSEGIARYDKAGLTGETSAKTRLICLSNVRGEGLSLQDYNTGVQAAQKLVGQNEDLSRFDLTLTATDDEVSGEIINKDRSHEDRQTFSPVEQHAFRELAMFAWSLKPEQIDFTVGAYRTTLTETLRLCKIYHPSLPVFKAGSGRLKLARVALAIACVQFAWNEQAGKLVVEAKHVLAASTLLDKLYKKPSFGYARYSKMQYLLQKVINPDETLAKIESIFKERKVSFYEFISHSHTFTKFDIAEAIGVNQMFVERIISQMFLSNLLKRGEQRSEWMLSRAGRKWVEAQLL